MPKDDGRAGDGAVAGESVTVDADCGGEARVSTFGKIDVGLLMTMFPLFASRSKEIAPNTTANIARAAANHQTALKRRGLSRAEELSAAEIRTSITGETGWTTRVTS